MFRQKNTAQLEWEPITSNHGTIHRAKVPGGWLIIFEGFDKGGITFYPDPHHEWDGKSL